jgi:glycine/D-amino acid oxidase-like deaminating enzyme
VRTERRCTGYDMAVKVVRPARSRVVTTRTTIPARRVTVATGAPVDKVQPLPGTTEVLSQLEYDAELAKAAVRQPIARAR